MSKRRNEAVAGTSNAKSKRCSPAKVTEVSPAKVTEPKDNRNDIPVVDSSQNCLDPIKDDFCDPDNPRQIQFQDVSAAAYKIKDGIHKTPCTKSRMSSIFGINIYFKKEFLQITGRYSEERLGKNQPVELQSQQRLLVHFFNLYSRTIKEILMELGRLFSFKERGARYALQMLSKEQKEKGVIAASAGNHALALSYHGHDLGIAVTVIMPIIAPIMKVSACRSYGANVIIHGADISVSKDYAQRLGKEKGLIYINGYDHPHILAGQGTMGLEILEQVPDLDACIIPVGGGGLIAGTALAIKNLRPDVKIIGVESEQCPSFSAALEAGKPVRATTGSTIADGLAVPTVGVNAFVTAQSLVDRMITVKEEYIALAILRLVELEKAVVEGAGATGLAAILEGLVPELEGKKVVVALCGGNIDTTALGRVIERGLAADHRLIRFVVTVSDRPGGIAELTKVLSDLGVSIKDIFHERAWLKSNIFNVQVKCVVETRDHDHASELECALRKKYKQVIWGPWYF